MYHFFVDPGQIGPTDIAITGSDVNHIRNVLRMQPGEQITVSSGEDEKEYRCEIRALSEEEVTAHIMWVEETGAELPSRISLFQGLPKADKMELVIQKAVELGAYELVPMATRRAVVKLDAKKEAAKLIKLSDKRRSKHYEHYTGRKWGSARNYNLCIDGGRIGPETAAKMIISAIK